MIKSLPIDFSCPNPNANAFFISQAARRMTDERKSKISTDYQQSPVKVYSLKEIREINKTNQENLKCM